MISARVSALAFATAIGLSTVAFAQTSPAPAPGSGPAGQHWNPAAMREHRQAREAAHLKALHDVLAIKPDQEAAFQAFGAAMHPEHPPGAAGRREPGAGWKDQAAHAPMTAPERADAMLKRFDQHTTHMREALEHHAAAVKTLYAALSPEQRRTFDALPMLTGGHGGEGRHGGWGGRGEGQGPRGPGQGMGHPGAGE